jgi:hypothetical protein
MRGSKLVFIALLLLAASCRDGTGAAGPSWFRASVSGEISSDYEGTGDFYFNREEDRGPQRYFNIYSRGSRTDKEETFWFRWPNDNRPRTGTYALVPHTDRHGSPHGVTGIYHWRIGDNVTAPANSELYVATGGSIQITRSTAEEIEGTIRFSGVQIGKRGPLYPERDDPRYAPDPNAPKVEVSGSFRLKRFDIDDVVVRNTN